VDEEALHTDLCGENPHSGQCYELGGARKLAERLQGAGKIADPHKFTAGGWNIYEAASLTRRITQSVGSWT
jgi:hypothetical protein